MRVIISAEAYGYGPAAKAVAIARRLDAAGHAVTFVGHGVADQFAVANGELFTARRVLDSIGELADLDSNDFDVAVSVMEPSLSVWASAERLPVLYVDSLFWMWNWSDDDLERLQTLTVHIQRASAADGLRELDETDMHDAQYVGHAVSDLVCAQRYGDPPDSAVRAGLPVRYVGPIVDEVGPGASTEPTILASISGMDNPLTTREQSVGWAEAVARLVVDAHTASGVRAELRIAGNADILGALTSPRYGRVEIASFRGHRELLQYLTRSVVSLAPPGLTSIAEAYAYGVPFIALPEQHYAHGTIFRELHSRDAEAFPTLLSGSDSSHGSRRSQTKAVIEHATEALTGPDRGTLVASLARRFVEASSTEPGWHSAQGAILHEVFGDPSGTTAVVDAIERVRRESE